MTEDPERELTPEEDARIRSLLASAVPRSTVPDDVAARLDSVLADLAADRDAERPTCPRAPGPARGGAGAGCSSPPRSGVGVVGLAAVNLPQLSAAPGRWRVQRPGGEHD